MKILFTSHRFHPDMGGIEVNSEILAGFFQSEGHDVRLVTQSLGSHEREFPYPVIRQPSALELIYCYLWADLVYQNNIELRTLWPSFIIRRPTVVSLRTWIRDSSGAIRMVHRLKRWSLGFVDAVIAVSDAVRADSFRKAVVIGNPYRSCLFRVIPEIVREKSVVYLGRFVSDKGIDLLIRALAQLKILCPSLTLIGAGPDEIALRRLAEDLDVCANFTGPLGGEELVRELNKHMILVVPSLWEEPFGNVALEGMACGCAVLGSNGGGLPDAIGPAGLLFERGDVHDLCEKLRGLLTNVDLINTLLDKAPAHLANHTENVVAMRYLEVLQTAAGN